MIPSFDVIECAPFDYIHCILLGVGKALQNCGLTHPLTRMNGGYLLTTLHCIHTDVPLDALVTIHVHVLVFPYKKWDSLRLAYSLFSHNNLFTGG